MKYLRGYLAAAIFGAITWILMKYGQRFSTLVDMVYPYVIRNLQGILAQWSGQVDFCLWQLLAVFFGVLVLASLVLMVVLKWNPIQWAGWVLAAVSCVYMFHTALYGLNYYAGDLSDDIRLSVTPYTLEELVEATTYYRDHANELAGKIKRDQNNYADYEEFEVLAKKAADGFHYLTYTRHFPIFAGSTQPVKKLGWSDMYTSMGITGFTFGLTGEAAVNPQAPETSLPFTMCHEMAHRMCIASERDANFSAFLACSSNEDVQFQYSGYFMAYRYCINALATVNSYTAAEAVVNIQSGVTDDLAWDMAAYDAFYRSHQKPTATKIGDTVNDTYLKTSGEAAGVASYGQVCDLLVNWHLQEVVLPQLAVEEDPFDPLDKTQVDLTGIVNARGA